MKKILIGIATVASLLTTGVYAADLARPVYTKAPVMVDPIFNWTGFYIGGNLGYSWGRSSDTIDVHQWRWARYCLAARARFGLERRRRRWPGRLQLAGCRTGCSASKATFKAPARKAAAISSAPPESVLRPSALLPSSRRAAVPATPDSEDRLVRNGAWPDRIPRQLRRCCCTEPAVWPTARSIPANVIGVHATGDFSTNAITCRLDGRSAPASKA